MTALEDYLPDDHALITEVDDQFRIVDESGAVWAMRKLAQSRRKMTEHSDVAKAEQERIARWLDEVQTPLQNDVDFFTGMLKVWHAERLAAELGANPMHGAVDVDAWKKLKHKTAKLPNGEIPARIGAGLFSVADAEGVKDWLTAHDADDLLTYRPMVGAEKFEQAIADGVVRATVDEYGTQRYWLLQAVDEVTDDVAARIVPLVDDPYADGETIVDTFDLSACAAIVGEGHRTSLTVTQELGEPAKVRAWVLIPGVTKIGVGLVTITVKPS